ncbi:hypothetical protein BO79DRAFT_75705 [Aspergillus costaricaensis CBS 115574]|uniref:Uncharacterized protein n=1 Tax=Aspergillus costaricaensis CBS 115574 TaxID=1448317 RepID=A0ACD1IN54_9EURO|nr:hypothetical protein BO79DRAFT_75705 [Aspergillus costaricaensis CBS 115574]RAK91471.1 hypothetical protein BO79DRAFT_75705 [Aspergillus costaricaensis CBS 115574]
MAGMGALDLGVSVLLWFERFCCFANHLFFLPFPGFCCGFFSAFFYLPFLFVFCLSNTSFPFGHNGMAVRWRGYGWRYLSVCILLILYVPHSPSSI